MLQAGQVIGDSRDLFGVGVADDQQAALGMAEHVQMRVPPVPGIERHPHQVGGRGAAEQVSRLDRVVFQHPDPVAGLEARGQHGVGQAQRAPPGFRKSQAPVTMHYGFEVRIVGGRPPHQGSHIHLPFPPFLE